MNDLPSRHSIRHRYDDDDDDDDLTDGEVRELTATIMYAYGSGELMTAAEWRRTIDPAEFAKVLIDNAGAIAAAEMIKQAATGADDE
jgi:hypothetical protein